jgi:hypothetical protein
MPFLVQMLKTWLIDLVVKRVKKELNFKPADLTSFILGNKKTTIRLGNKNIKPGPIAVLKDGEHQDLYKLEVSKIRKTNFGHLTALDARLDGFSDIGELRQELETIYKKPITNNTKITQVFLRPQHEN